MGALPIVKDFNVFKEGLPRFLSGMKIMAMDQFCFQRGDETLHRRIVPTIAFAAHRATDAILAQLDFPGFAGHNLSRILRQEVSHDPT